MEEGLHARPIEGELNSEKVRPVHEVLESTFGRIAFFDPVLVAPVPVNSGGLKGVDCWGSQVMWISVGHLPF